MGEQNKICFAEPKQPKAFGEGLSLEIPLVRQPPISLYCYALLVLWTEQVLHNLNR